MAWERIKNYLITSKEVLKMYRDEKIKYGSEATNYTKADSRSFFLYEKENKLLILTLVSGRRRMGN